MKTKAKKAFFFRLNRRQMLAVLSVIVLIGAILEMTNTTHIFHKQKPVSGIITSTTPNTDSSLRPSNRNANQSTPSSNGTSSTPKSSTAVSDSSAPLAAPYGSFVSNHRPSLSGAGGVPSQEASVCTTTPGASCYISFSRDGVTKTLETQTADSKGSVSWNWDIKKSGLTEGTWSITATSTLNGQTKSTSDSLGLVVNP